MYCCFGELAWHLSDHKITFIENISNQHGLLSDMFALSLVHQYLRLTITEHLLRVNSSLAIVCDNRRTTQPHLADSTLIFVLKRSMIRLVAIEMIAQAPTAYELIRRSTSLRNDCRPLRGSSSLKYSWITWSSTYEHDLIVVLTSR